LPAKAATAIIPIVFMIGSDPVQLGLVASLNRPGGNLTGFAYLNDEIAPKRLELLHDFIPAAKSIALLVNPANPSVAAGPAKGLQGPADALGVRLTVVARATLSNWKTSSRPLCAIGLRHFSSASILCSATTSTKSSLWRHAARYRQSIRGVNLPRLAVS